MINNGENNREFDKSGCGWSGWISRAFYCVLEIYSKLKKKGGNEFTSYTDISVSVLNIIIGSESFLFANFTGQNRVLFILAVFSFALLLILYDLRLLVLIIREVGIVIFEIEKFRQRIKSGIRR